MANSKYLAKLKKSIEGWNAWRRANPKIVPDLRRADLNFAHLIHADLSGADLTDANLTGAHLVQADLTRADLSGANLVETVFDDTNLKEVQGLDACVHCGPSTIDHRTLAASGPLPLSFLRGCGLPDELIEYLPSLLNRAIQFYSCFISYSTKDRLFVERLHADLQDKNVRCWFAPHDLPIGAKTWDAIDEAIRVRDKGLLVLSQAAIDSDWVEDEVSKAYAEERARKTLVLFPIRIDDSVMTTNEPWARKLRDQRNIGDFLRWTEPSEYNKSLERVLRDLKDIR
jgi:TIR domain/Pentapeptide repeats (8 copies)